MSGIYLIIFCIISIFVFLIVLFEIKKYYARKQVRKRLDYEKLRDLNNLVKLYGYIFDPMQEIFYSKMDAWQRDYGYCRLYDEIAPTINLAMDCEPIIFDYDNRYWMIEFWKGQYGILTGGEIGVYVTDEERIEIPEVFSGRFYESVTDEERLRMSFILRKGGREVLERKGYHWWLTGFRIGEFSKPRQLTMEWEILFPNVLMRDSFMKGLLDAGYRLYELQIDTLYVRGMFSTPRTRQPRRRWGFLIPFVQWVNKNNCWLFRNQTREFKRTLDKIDYIRCCFPGLYRLAIRIGQKKRIPKIYEIVDQGRK